MFRFHLVKDDDFVAYGVRGEVQRAQPQIMTRKTNFAPIHVDIRSTDNNQCVNLKHLMENGEETEGLPNASGNSGLQEKLDWRLSVEIGIHPYDDTGRDYVRVWGAKEGNVLTRLENALDSCGLEAKVNVKIRGFGVSKEFSVNVVTEEVAISEVSSDQGSQLHYSGTWDKATRDHTNSNERKDFRGYITVSIVASPKNRGDLFDTFFVSEEKPYIVHKMLKEGLDSDATIIASDGKEIKCHKTILKAQSVVFEAMFNPTYESQENTTGIIRIEDMSSRSVRAFLAFLYSDDLEDVKKYSAVALDVFKAAHKYNVPRLEKRMTEILLEKSNKWFNVDVAIQLFIFAKQIQSNQSNPQGKVGETLEKTLETLEELKTKAIAALKSDLPSVWASSTWKQLFEEDPEAARELSQYLASRAGFRF